MGVNEQGTVFARLGSGSFQIIDGPQYGLKYVAVGDGAIIGSDRYDEVYYRTGISPSKPFGTTWRRMGGRAKQLSIGDGKILGVQRDGRIVYRTGVSERNPYGDNWTTMPGRAKWISVGDGRIATIRDDDSIWFRSGVSESRPFGDDRSGEGGWEMMAGRLKQIQVGNSMVIGVNDRNEMIYRDGVTSSAMGTSWTKIPGEYSYVATGNGNILGLATNGRITVRSIPMTTPVRG